MHEFERKIQTRLATNGSDSSIVISEWTLYIQDMDDSAVVIDFQVADDESSIILGMDIKRY